LSGNARPVIGDRNILRAIAAVQPDLQHDIAALGRELHRIGEEIQDHLPDGALVGPDLRQVRLDGLANNLALSLCTQG
jgi:hypothetical protein